ncbi:class I SAM-dependent methyltransferase [Treponema parvum]|uniref:class I SAM-dependent methyltransferase n=1 Tax=Treponema parvum TaxID=138851 RepID=UPI001AEBFAC0|nr:SAM-dependent methyltransferase [Treponema parvum]QTQ15228.1 SAM-dependent methyltransferase [Treponema parvum]
MILSVSFSKPNPKQKTACQENPSGIPQNCLRIKVRPVHRNAKINYFAEFFTKTQVFHKTFSEKELLAFIDDNAGKTFLQCVYRTETEEITILGNKSGHVSRFSKKTSDKPLLQDFKKKKNYLIREGDPVPFLVLLGIMTPSGKILSSKHDKFRQINRFLEFIDDIIDDVLLLIQKEEADKAALSSLSGNTRPLRIADFGCGKSYLTFAVYHYLTQIKKIDAKIVGLDLKEDVIEYCSALSKQCGYKDLSFEVGNIADHKSSFSPDIMITLHACDTATDYALLYAVENRVKAILSVPCCQHEINSQLENRFKSQKADISDEKNVFASVLKHGILKERFSAIVTDALRADFLESSGYKVQVLEFIDSQHTPKNLLIRAVKKTRCDKKNSQAFQAAEKRSSSLIKALGIKPTIFSNFSKDV